METATSNTLPFNDLFVYSKKFTEELLAPTFPTPQQAQRVGGAPTQKTISQAERIKDDLITHSSSIHDLIRGFWRQPIPRQNVQEILNHPYPFSAKINNLSANTIEIILTIRDISVRCPLDENAVITVQ